MEESIFQVAKQINQFHQEAVDIYFLLVEDVCEWEISEDELTHLLDYLLDFTCDTKILALYKKVCRKYLYKYPSCIKFYIEAYWEMWEDDNN